VKWMFRCPTCGAEYDIVPGRYLCDRCAATQQPERPLEGILECVWEGDPSYKGRGTPAPLPVERRYFPPLPETAPSLWRPTRLGERLGLRNLFVQYDGGNPSGSFKDRASALVAAFATREKIGEIVLASTGNAASSMACMGAAAGLKVTVFVPSSAPAAKRVQILQYGARLESVDGTYDVAYERSLAWCRDPSRSASVVCRNTGYNPLTIEGKKTVAFDVIDGLEASHSGPVSGSRIHVFVPTGDGAVIAGAYKGFEDLVRLGRLDRVPTLWACQAEGSSAIFRALRDGAFGDPVPSSTIADSIAVDVPRAGAVALRKLIRHGGKAATVSDAEILEAQTTASSYAGIFVEPSSCVAFACLVARSGDLPKDAIPVVLATGSGLKDIASAARAVGLELQE